MLPTIPTSPLTPFAFERRDPGPHDVQIEILYCGICHTDLHQARNHWGGSMYPMVPGHEIVGRVTRVGAQVTKVKADDYAGVGCMVDSCRRCSACNEGLEQYCEEGPTWTYNAKERGSEQLTFGGYSERVVVEERFVVKVPGQPRHEGCRSTVLCRHYDLFSTAPLGSRQRPEGRRDRPWWPRPHGRQVRQGTLEPTWS